MADYELTWIGDKVREYKTKAGEPYRSCRIAVRDSDGNRITKLELTRPADRDLPTVGDTVSGRIEKHPRFDDLQRLVEGAGGEGPSGSLSSSGGGSAPADTSRDRSIERQVALKVAGVVVASYAAQGVIKPEEYGDYIAKFTEAGVDAIRGRVESEGKPEEKPGGGTDIDSDIPF